MCWLCIGSAFGQRFQKATNKHNRRLSTLFRQNFADMWVFRVGCATREFHVCFAQATSVKRSDVQRIEYLIRKGVKQLQTFKGSDVSGFGGTHTAEVPEAARTYFDSSKSAR